MTRTKGLAVAFYVGAVLAGAAIGVTVDRWLLREQLVERFDDPQAMRRHFADQLRMDSAQRAALDTILDARNARYDALMSPVRPQLDSIRGNARQQIRQLLTPEQQATYDKMQREQEAARRQEKK